MRTTRLTSLVVLGVVLVLGGGRHASAAGRTGGDKKLANAGWVVRGYGITREDANNDALRKAQAELLDYLAGQGLRLEYSPSLEFVGTALVKDWEEEVPKEIQDVGLVRQVRLRVELSQRDLGKILRQDRQVRAQNRMLFLGKVLAGLVAFFAAVGGYFRLEEATKGYYTAWLRLVAIGFVAAVGAGLWWIC
jgi:hypothetical protein